MKLQLGKRYIGRNGLVTGPLENSGSEEYPFRDAESGRTYTGFGCYFTGNEKSDRDLISEYIEEAVGKDDEEAENLWDKYAMAALAAMNYDWFESSSRITDMVSEAATLADAMLAARKERA